MPHPTPGRRREGYLDDGEPSLARYVQRHPVAHRRRPYLEPIGYGQEGNGIRRLELLVHLQVDRALDRQLQSLGVKADIYVIMQRHKREMVSPSQRGALVLRLSEN